MSHLDPDPEAGKDTPVVGPGLRLAAGLMLAAFALVGLLPLVAHCAEPTPTPAPRLRFASYTWTEHGVFKGTQDRTVIFGARAAADYDLMAGVHVIGRADASALGEVDGTNTVDINDPTTYQSLELYAGAYRPVAQGLAVIVVAGLAIPIDSGRPDVSSPHPKTIGAGLSAVLDDSHETYGVFMAGYHQAAGPGLKFLATGQVHVYGRSYLVGDAAIGGAGSFARGGVALRLK